MPNNNLKGHRSLVIVCFILQRNYKGFHHVLPADLIVPWQPNEQKLCFSNAQFIGHGQPPLLRRKFVGPWISVFWTVFGMFWLPLLLGVDTVLYTMHATFEELNLRFPCCWHQIVLFLLLHVGLFFYSLCCSSFSSAPGIALLVVCTVLAAH